MEYIQTNQIGDETVTASCLSCPEGHELSGETCVPCAPGFASFDGKACVPCDRGEALCGEKARRWETRLVVHIPKNKCTSKHKPAVEPLAAHLRFGTHALCGVRIAFCASMSTSAIAYTSTCMYTAWYLARHIGASTLNSTIDFIQI